MLATLALTLGLLFAQATPAHELMPADQIAKPAGSETSAELQEVGEKAMTPAEHIFEHVRDERTMVKAIPLPAAIFGEGANISIGKHALSMFIASFLLVIVCASVVRKRSLVPRGAYSVLESFVVFIRDDIAVQNIGHGGERYTPFLCTAFFFILFINVLGLVPIPHLGTATGNLSVTMVLALFTFFVTQIAGMRSQGIAGYWLHLVPAGVPKLLYPIMIPVEILGLFTKPFALTVRLFANMLAGHVVIYFLIALTIIISVWVAPISVGFALAIYMLELFVALVQAYVFTMLSAVFIGLASHSH